MLELRYLGRLRQHVFGDLGFPDVRAPMLLPNVSRNLLVTEGIDLLVFSSTCGGTAASIFCVEVDLNNWQILTKSSRLLLDPGPEKSFYGGGVMATGCKISPEGFIDLYFSGFRRDDDTSGHQVLSPGLLRFEGPMKSSVDPVQVLRPLVDEYSLVGSLDEPRDPHASGGLLFAAGGEGVQGESGTIHPSSRLWSMEAEGSAARPMPISLDGDEFAHTRPQMLRLGEARYLLFSTRHLDGSYRQSCAEEVLGTWERRPISVVWGGEGVEMSYRDSLCYAFVAPSSGDAPPMISASLDFRGNSDVLIFECGRT